MALSTTGGLNNVAALMGETAGGTIYAYMGWGTGTTAENASQTALVAEHGTRVAATISKISIFYPGDTIRFAANMTAAGSVTIAELGVFTAVTSGSMLARKLLDAADRLTLVSGDTAMAIYDFTARQGTAAS